jgi:hypothetical protein
MDVLQAFLGAELEIKEKVTIKRLGVDLEIKALTNKTIKKLTDQSTFGNTVDEMKLNGLFVASAVTNLNFADPKLLEKYEASDAVDCVNKALLPGELVTVVKAITKVSGFEDINEQIQAAKN